jgi:2-polyprenyl-6-methoxyphenol hydroxylase-like FAD-dependent oxidoreductase
MESQVIIVGAGPVGLTLAIDLGRRGVRCVLLEQKEAPAFLPKMERCNARTMELYRRIGLADKIRAAGLRSDVPMDVFIITAMNEPPLWHQVHPSVDAAREQFAQCRDGSLPVEPYQLISQYTLEPLLKSVAETLPSISVRYGCAFESFDQDETGITAHVRTTAGAAETIRAAYLVGCDGGSSAVRKQLGIRLRGEGNLMEFRQALFHCPDLFDRIPIGPGPGRGRHYHAADAAASFLIMQDSTKHFTLHARVEDDAAMLRQFDAVIGIQVPREMLSCAPWRHNLLLADRYGSGRVFLAGDAVHLVIPTGGLGMNSGVGDAFDLSWKLAGTLQGWGGPQLLRSYEIERRQIGERNVGASRYASLGRRKWRSLCGPKIRENTAEGQAARDHLVHVADIEQRKSNEMIGAELGYRYVDSPIIDNIPGGPEQPLRVYEPTTWPGARLPNVWLEPGVALQDRIPNDGYTLLRLGRSAADTGALEQAMRATGASLTVLDLANDNAREVYGYDLLLLRPDLHVGWRGNKAPDDANELAAVITGHGVP